MSTISSWYETPINYNNRYRSGTIYDGLIRQSLRPAEVERLERDKPKDFKIVTGIIAPVGEDTSICSRLYFNGTDDKTGEKIAGVFKPAYNTLVQKYDTRDLSSVPPLEQIVDDTERFWGKVHLWCPDGNMNAQEAGVVVIEYIRPLKFVN